MRKNLFLIGSNTTYPERVAKELVNEVPTFGDPGSDNLLVAGLAGTHQDVQAVPVGRLKVFTNDAIRGYLEKVRSYEQESLDISWRKNALHMSGGQNSSEIQVLRNILSDLLPIVNNSDYSGKVKTITKSISSPTVEKINISNEINQGVGLVTFFGHGSQTVTDLDIGYASDVARGYANRNRYPLMYFNGCGVGNIFTNTTVHVLSDDWVGTPGKGAIAIIANSYNSYVSPSAKHIRVLYETLFEQNGTLSVGEILKKTAEKIVAGNANAFDIANLHQVCLQGDPALVLVTASEPDYVVNSENNDIFIRSTDPGMTFDQTREGQIGVVVSNGGLYREGDEIDVKVMLWYGTELVETTVSTRAMRQQDTLWLDAGDLQNLSRIEVRIDPENTLTEFTKLNNISDLPVDWIEIKDQSLYPLEPLKDRIPPRFKVLFDDREIPNKSSVSPHTSITFVVEDDRVIDFPTSTVEVYLRNCWDRNCEATPITIDADWVYNPDSRELIIKYQGGPLTPGEYELFLSGSDRSGNTPVEGGYVIQFRIEDAESQKALVVLPSPNPASPGFVKFLFDNIPPASKELTLRVFNMRGESVLEQKLDRVEDHQSMVWFWDTTNIPSGVYVYRVMNQLNSGEMINGSSGKVVIVN